LDLKVYFYLELKVYFCLDPKVYFYLDIKVYFYLDLKVYFYLDLKVYFYLYLKEYFYLDLKIYFVWTLRNIFIWTLRYIYTPAPRRGRGVYCFIIPPLPGGGGGILFYLSPSVCPSVEDSFRRIFLSNYRWQKCDIWSQASYRYAILWVALLDPSDSYFLFADLVGFYTHLTYTCMIFGHKLHIGTPYRGKSFWTHQIPTSCLPTWLVFIHIEHTWICGGIISEH
jgi:hypothetical protein